MPDRPHVALIVETSIHYGRQVLQGITRYVRSHQPWSCFLEQRELWASPPPWLNGWKGSGVICRKTTPALAKMLGRAKIPVVDLSDIQSSFGVPRIESDHKAIGALAADHLLERGFTQFAFCGFSDQTWSIRRREGFLARLQERGFTSLVWESPRPERQSHPWEKEQALIAQWLRSLPRPIGIMACNDMRGQHVLDACQRVDIAVPEGAAVIGVDDDAVLCNLCHPPLSSVVPNAEPHRLRSGGIARSTDVRRKSARRADADSAAGNHHAQSSDVLAIDDAVVASALRFIRERACQGCGMKDLLRHVPMSRSLLERKFRQYLGRSPQAEIRARAAQARQTITGRIRSPAGSNLTTGWIYAPRIHERRFQARETGQTPGQYRAAGNPAFAKTKRT